MKKRIPIVDCKVQKLFLSFDIFHQGSIKHLGLNNLNLKRGHLYNNPLEQ